MPVSFEQARRRSRSYDPKVVVAELARRYADSGWDVRLILDDFVFFEFKPRQPEVAKKGWLWCR